MYVYSHRYIYRRPHPLHDSSIRSEPASHACLLDLDSDATLNQEQKLDQVEERLLTLIEEREGLRTQKTAFSTKTGSMLSCRNALFRLRTLAHA